MAEDTPHIMTPTPAPSGPTAQTAPYPFDMPADIVLRSSDGVDFHVWRGILIAASPFFQGMFSLPQPNTDSSLLEPISMEEDSRTLEILLRLCYPLAERVPPDLKLEETRAVLTAAIKYDMEAATVPMRRELLSFAGTQPLRVYAITCILGLEPEARHAATIAIQQKAVLSEYVEELEDMSAGCFYRLIQFRDQAYPKKDFKFTSAAIPRDPLVSDSAICTDSEQELRDAAAPFDRPDADVVIVSQDRVRFRVHSIILKIASPVFAKMLDNPVPYPHPIFERDAEVQGLAHYCVLPESSATLQTMFGLLCYPSDPPSAALDGDGAHHFVIHAAVKYSLQNIIQTFRFNWNLLILVWLKPLQSFTIAAYYGWTDEAKQAALLTLRVDKTELQAIYDPMLEILSSDVYFRLLKYHQACGRAVSNATGNWRQDGAVLWQFERWKLASCRCQSDFSVSELEANIDGYIENAQRLLVDKPLARTSGLPEVDEGLYTKFLASISMEACGNCREQEIKLALNFARELKDVVDQQISLVSFELKP